MRPDTRRRPPCRRRLAVANRLRRIAGQVADLAVEVEDAGGIVQAVVALEIAAREVEGTAPK
jgi:hypothetical protein